MNIFFEQRPYTARRTLAVLTLLAVLMILTRYHHFGSAVALPDASTAVFFLAGGAIPNLLALPALLALAGVVDYLAIGIGGVSDWCVTPAYPFLLFGHAALWLAGRRCIRLPPTNWAPLRFAAVLWAASTAAFLISNAGFYAFSGYFAAMSAGQFSAAVAQYYPPYVGWTFFYVVLALLARAATTALEEFVVLRTGR